MSSTTLTRADWDLARSFSVFFGHQSVGENILDGLRAIATKEGWPELHVVEGTSAPTAEPVLLHVKVGQNGDPQSKIAGFRQSLEAGAGTRAKIAVLKFCFWDIRHDTDVTRVFDDYQKMVTAVGAQFPTLSLVHSTVPLVIEDKDWRARLRRLLAQPVPTDLDNARREELNAKIRTTYGERVFDIARAEEEPGASRGGRIPCLAEDFSSDGAHLNEAGRRQVASAFVRSLDAAARASAAR